MSVQLATDTVVCELQQMPDFERLTLLRGLVSCVRRDSCGMDAGLRPSNQTCYLFATEDPLHLPMDPDSAEFHQLLKFTQRFAQHDPEDENACYGYVSQREGPTIYPCPCCGRSSFMPCDRVGDRTFNIQVLCQDYSDFSGMSPTSPTHLHSESSIPSSTHPAILDMLNEKI